MCWYIAIQLNPGTFPKVIRKHFMFSYYFQSLLKKPRNFWPLFKLYCCSWFVTPTDSFERWGVLVLQYTYPLGSDNGFGPFFHSWQSTQCCTGTDGIFSSVSSFIKVLAVAVPLPACPAGERLCPGSMRRLLSSTDSSAAQPNCTSKSRWARTKSSLWGEGLPEKLLNLLNFV